MEGLSGVTGHLLETRVRGYNRCNELLKQHSLVSKDSVAKKLLASYSGKGNVQPDIPDPIRTCLASYQAQVTRIELLQDQVRTWTVASSEEPLAELEAAAPNLATLAKNIQEHLAQRYADYLQQRKVSLAEASTKAKDRRKVLGLWKQQGQENWARFLYAREALVFDQKTEGSQGQQGQQPRRVLLRRQSRPDEDEQQAATAVSNCKKQATDDNYWSVGEPTLFPRGEQGLASIFTSLQGHFGQQVELQLGKVFDALKIQPGPGYTVTLPEQGAPTDTLGQLLWVPEAYRVHGKRPEFLNTFGSAWLAVQMAGGARHRPSGVPVDGLGQLVQNIEGFWVIACWPAYTVLDRGASLANQSEFLAEMAAEAFDQWAKDHVKWAQLPAGSAFWVPYGWHMSALATYSQGRGRAAGEQTASALLMQPYLQASMVSDATIGQHKIRASAANLMEHLVKVIQAKEEGTLLPSQGQLTQHATAFAAWLHQVMDAKILPALPATAPDRADSQASVASRDSGERSNEQPVENIVGQSSTATMDSDSAAAALAAEARPALSAEDEAAIAAASLEDLADLSA